MTTALQSPPVAKLLTYEAYMAEEENNLRYDIIDGERIFMPGATDEHQDVVFNIAAPFNRYATETRRGRMRQAPRDVLITRIPLHTRQPDVYFISAERNAQNPTRRDPAPLDLAPELIVEVVSDSERDRILYAKIADYCAVGVREGWVVRPVPQTVEVLRLSVDGYESVRIYGAGETVQSITFPDLFVAVDAVFAG